ncbi:hypothetical protein M3Y99_00210600 [Aphelenchoides fujianensis]|nr:hypothetical protein M3Y99_00210600 [Aphelenchoides fujianensis]
MLRENRVNHLLQSARFVDHVLALTVDSAGSSLAEWRWSDDEEVPFGLGALAEACILQNTRAVTHTHFRCSSKRLLFKWTSISSTSATATIPPTSRPTSPSKRARTADFSDVIDEDVWQTTQELVSSVCASLDRQEDEYVENELSAHLEECLETPAGPEIVVIDGGTLSSDEEEEDEPEVAQTGSRRALSVASEDARLDREGRPGGGTPERRPARRGGAPAADDQPANAEEAAEGANPRPRSQFSSASSYRRSAASPINADLPNEKEVQTARDPALLETSLVHCCSAIAQISSRLPEANDQLDAYRFASSLFVNSRLLEVNEQLNWRVNALGGGLKRAHMELTIFKKRRREKMQEQWEEVQTYIRRKNKRIHELTDQMNGADIDVGILLASHKEKIEQACIAERNLFRMSGKVEDLELELQKKTKLLDERRCPRCESSAEETEKEKREQEARLKQREQRRQQLEAVERQQFARADRTWTRVSNRSKTPNLPWHHEPKEAVGPSGLPLFVPPDGRNPPQNRPPTADVVPASTFELTRLRLEQAERNAHRQEILNAALTRELTNCKNEMARLRAENQQLKGRVNRLNGDCERLRSTARVPRPPHRAGRTPSETNTTRTKEKEGVRKNLLPRPPAPPILQKSPMAGVDTHLSPPLGPPISETQREIRQIDEQLEQLNQRRNFHEQRREPSPPVIVLTPIPSAPPVKRFFPPTVRPSSPERAAKRPALGPPPLHAPLLPPARRPPAFHEPPVQANPPSDRRLSTRGPTRRRPNASSPSVLESSWAERNHRGELVGAASNGWRQPPAHPPHFNPPPARPVILNGRPPMEMRPLPNGPPSFRPPPAHYSFDQPPRNQHRNSSRAALLKSDAPAEPPVAQRRPAARPHFVDPTAAHAAMI